MLWAKALRSPHHSRGSARSTRAEGRGASPASTRSSRTTTSRTTSTATSRGSASRATSRCCAEDEVRYKGQPIAVVAAESEETAQAAVDAIEVDYEEREPIFDIRTAFDPESPASTRGARSTRTSGRTTTAGSARATSTGRSSKADVIVEGVYRPQAIEHCPLEPQIALAVPEPTRPADDLLLHAGHVLLDGRRRRAPAVAAEQAQVRRRHGRRRLRRQGRHRDRDDLLAARAQGAAAGQVALDARGGVPRLVDARALAHGDRRRGHERRLDPRPQDADAARRRRLHALLAPTG